MCADLTDSPEPTLCVLLALCGYDVLKGSYLVRYQCAGWTDSVAGL